MSGSSIRAAVELVWNKGIAARCDWRIPDEFPNGTDYSPVSTLAGALPSARLPDNLISNPEVFKQVQNGQVIWVRLSWLKSFAKQALPLIPSKFVLATGDSDGCVPSETAPEARAILACPNLVHWFAQNYDGSLSGERISPLPIGLDFHTQAERPIWGEPLSSPSRQEDVLKSIQQELEPSTKRVPKVYVDFAWQQGFGLFNHRRYHPLRGATLPDSRRRIARLMRKNASVFCQPRPLPRAKMWRERGQFVFVLSPHGMGLDCHRTWEALALGHIVIVPSSSLDLLYAGLPVVCLKSWKDINAENLKEWLILYSELSDVGKTNEKLISANWIDRMRSVPSTHILTEP